MMLLQMNQLPCKLQDLLPHALILAAGYLLVQVILFVVERRRMHRTFERMKISGPKPNLIHGHFLELKRESSMRFYDRLLKEYGKTAGFYLGGDPFVVTKDLALIQEVFAEKCRTFADRQPARLEVEPVPQSIFSLRGVRWHYVRKLLTPAFAKNKIKTDAFYRDTQQTVENFVGQLERNSELVEYDGKKQRETLVEDLYDRMVACAVDVIVKSVFHLSDIVSFDGRLRNESSKHKSWVIQMEDWIMGALGMGCSLRGDHFLSSTKQAASMVSNPVVVLTYCFPALEKPFTFLCNHLYLGPILDLFFKRIDSLTQRASKAETKGVDTQNNISATMPVESEGRQRRIIDTLLQVLREGKITVNEVKGNAMAMVFAGFETTANALTFTLWLLAKDERVQTKLRNELRARMNKIVDTNERGEVKSAKELTQAELGELVAGCEYLESVINESLRLFPPAPAITFRQANEDITLSNGMHVEKGVSFTLPLFSIHRDEAFWGKEAHLFKPERFDMLDARQLKSPMFIPFGIGHRVCIGKMLALHELKIMIGRLLLDYLVAPWEGKTPEELKLSSPSIVSMTCAEKVGLRFVKL